MNELSILAKALGSKGGRNRAKNLSKERRREIARMGGLRAQAIAAEKRRLDAKPN